MTEQTRERLREKADPKCTSCDGDGFYTIAWNNDPNRCEEVSCFCTTRNHDEEEEAGYGSGV
jgi:hypothetical protein